MDIVRFWKGSEKAYKELYVRGRIKEDVKYTVLMDDGTFREYLGVMPLQGCELEQIPMVDDVVSRTRFKCMVGTDSVIDKRLLVGDDNAFSIDGKLLDDYEPSSNNSWYVVIFGKNASVPLQVIDFSNRSAKVKSLGMREYQVVDGILRTYDGVYWAKI